MSLEAGHTGDDILRSWCRIFSSHYPFTQRQSPICPTRWHSGDMGGLNDWPKKTEPLTTSWIQSICPSRDGHRLLVGSWDGTVRMRNMEDLGNSQPAIQDVTDTPEVIGFSPSGKMVATKSQQTDCVELRDTTTWELVGSMDVEEGHIEVAFSADDKRIAILTRNRVTICDIMHPEKRLSFNPWPKGRHVYKWKAAFQTCYMGPGLR